VIYLLFCDEHTSDHDVLVTDFVACYSSIEECKQRHEEMGKEAYIATVRYAEKTGHPVDLSSEFRNPALIASFDGSELSAVERFEWHWDGQLGWQRENAK